MSNPVCTADFNWHDDDAIVAREQPAIAVYTNAAGAVVVRQERAWDEDSDVFILIQPENAEKIADAIMQAAGAPIVQGSDNRKDATAADRQRKRRARLRDSHGHVTRDDRDAPLLIDHQEDADQNAA